MRSHQANSGSVLSEGNPSLSDQEVTYGRESMIEVYVYVWEQGRFVKYLASEREVNTFRRLKNGSRNG